MDAEYARRPLGPTPWQKNAKPPGVGSRPREIRFAVQTHLLNEINLKAFGRVAGASDGSISLIFHQVLDRSQKDFGS